LSDSSSSSSSSDPDSDDSTDSEPEKELKRKRGSKWTAEQLKNLKMNFSHLAHIDDSILATLDFKDFHSSGQKRD